jgi:hypothetical protein
MEQKTHLKVAVVSPTDVLEERKSLEEVFDELNRSIASEKGFHLELVSWEKDAYPRFHEQGPQGAIDESLRIPDCEIVIGMFWARFGTPVSDASSGTEHELRIAYNSWKEKKRPHIMLYFKEPFPPAKTLEELDQLRKVLEFKQTFPQEALYGEYLDVDEFRRKVFTNMTQLLRDLAPGDPRLAEAVKPPPTPWRGLEEAPGSGAASDALSKVPLYTFCGLKAKLRDEDGVLQDFKVDRQPDGNPNPVSYLWADVYKGNSVTARVEEADPPHLSVTFENNPMSWACNIAIRFIKEQAVKRGERRTLAFETRLAAESHPVAGVPLKTCVSVRIINGWCQHWAYGSGGRYRLFPVTDTWEMREAPIETPLNSDKWWLFATDGNHLFGPREPDFSIISSVIFVFGGDGLSEPGPGRGTVLIRNVHLKK